MGNLLSGSKSKKSKVHNNCNCGLYNKHNHCCRQSCFDANRDATERLLKKALKKYNAEYLTSIILIYLPDVYDLVEISTKNATNGYLSYSYEPLQCILANKNPPCKTWIESLEESTLFKV